MSKGELDLCGLTPSKSHTFRMRSPSQLFFLLCEKDSIVFTREADVCLEGRHILTHHKNFMCFKMATPKHYCMTDNTENYLDKFPLAWGISFLFIYPVSSLSSSGIERGSMGTLPGCGIGEYKNTRITLCHRPHSEYIVSCYNLNKNHHHLLIM